ncbi:hypothetical protein GCM10027404_28320 [Arthrobacter tumbae]
MWDKLSSAELRATRPARPMRPARRFWQGQGKLLRVKPRKGCGKPAPGRLRIAHSCAPREQLGQNRRVYSCHEVQRLWWCGTEDCIRQFARRRALVMIVLQGGFKDVEQFPGHVRHNQTQRRPVPRPIRWATCQGIPSDRGQREHIRSETGGKTGQRARISEARRPVSMTSRLPQQASDTQVGKQRLSFRREQHIARRHIAMLGGGRVQVRKCLCNRGQDGDAFTNAQTTSCGHQVEEGSPAGMVHQECRTKVGADDIADPQEMRMLQRAQYSKLPIEGSCRLLPAFRACSRKARGRREHFESADGTRALIFNQPDMSAAANTQQPPCAVPAESGRRLAF